MVFMSTLDAMERIISIGDKNGKYDYLGLRHLIEDAGIKIVKRYKELTPSTSDLDDFSITINFTSSNEYDIDVY